MSDQDEISKLLAEANAQPDVAPAQDTVAPAPASTPRRQPPKIVGRNSDVLGVAWFNGALHAAAFHRQKMVRSWSCPTAVRTVAEFDTVVDDALAKLEFEGTEMFLLLENEHFAHQTEGLPVFSASARRSYLKGRIQRHEQEYGRVLWVSQPTVVVKGEQSTILHLLPNSFYDELNRVLLARHLDLTRILPLIVPLQYELNKIPVGKDTPVIAVAEVGASTSVVVGRVGGPLLFSRTILADLAHDASRVGVEVNRSLLFAKQQFDCAVDRIWLMAENGQAAAELRAKCGATRKITALPTSPVDWLQTTMKVSTQQPINLLAGYLRAKRRNSFIRSAVLIAAWVGLVLTVLNLLDDRRSWAREQETLAALRARASSLQAEQQQLTARNAAVVLNQSLIDRVNTGRAGPVPGRLLAFISSVLPANARLTDYSVVQGTEAPGWSFRIDGVIEADDETARDALAGLQTQLKQSPLRARFAETASAILATPVSQGPVADMQRFSMEGVVLE